MEHTVHGDWTSLFIIRRGTGKAVFKWSLDLDIGRAPGTIGDSRLVIQSVCKCVYFNFICS